MSEDAFPSTQRSELRRYSQRGTHQRSEVYAVLDEGLVCHVGFAMGDQPVVIPMTYGREGDQLFLHGSSKGRLLGLLSGGAKVCITVTLLDGLVLARSTFHSSFNYRSVVVFGEARLVEGDQAKLAALRIISDHIANGRSEEARETSSQELLATEVVVVTMEEATAKVRGGPPSEPAEDVRFPVWAGVIPLTMTRGAPVPAPDLADGIEPSSVVSDWER